VSSDYEIRQQALQLMDRLSESFGEVTEEDEAALDEILKGLDEPMDYLFFMQKKAEANAAECQELASIYTRQKQSWQKKRTRYRSRMQQLLEATEALGNGSQHKRNWGTASLGKSAKAVVTDLDLLPADLLRTKREAKGGELLKLLRAGETIEGAYLETSRNLTIRSK
jgi:hypothetical protein